MPHVLTLIAAPGALSNAQLLAAKAALSALGASYNVEVKSHVTAVDVENLEPYLHGVAMDDALSLDTMMSSSASLGAYLASCLSGDGTVYRFPQRVAHVTL